MANNKLAIIGGSGLYDVEEFKNRELLDIKTPWGDPSDKILKTISNLLEKGILTSKDIKREISTDLKFKKENIINKLNLVSRDEFEILKKIIQNQDLTIKKLLKKKKTKKAKKS